MINIFGKLYTFLRRPQQQQNEPANQTSNQGGAGQENANKGLTDSQSSDWVHVKTEIDHNTSGTDIDAAHMESKKDKDGEMVESKNSPGNDTMDMEAMAKLVDEMQAEREQGQGTGNTCEGASSTPAQAPSIEQERATPLVESESSEKDLPSPDIALPLQSQSEVSKATCNSEGEKTGKEEKKEGKEDHEMDKKDQKGNTDRNEKRTGRKTVQMCYYFRRGQKCFKGNRCPYSHDRETSAESKESTQEFIKEENFESYKDFVSEMTAHGKNINPKDLLYKMGYEKYNMETMGSVLIGQYKLAISKNRWHWVGQARYFAELFFPNGWIDENIPSKDGRKSGRVKDRPKQRKTNYNINEQYEGRRGMCQDIRLLENPNLTVVSSNFGNKNKQTTPDESNQGMEAFVTNYTNGIINEAVKVAAGEGGQPDDIRGAIREAMNEGLSESIIMEVIDDVTNTSTTPGKRGKVNKLDTTRTPRKRPEELAIGFNYLSAELVKHSPKTVDGGIICMETLPPSKERPDQLAFGFNYHADKLVKDSPRSEKGEVLIPGVVLTPGRKARDQLAMGFNYHSNVIVQESPKSADKENKSVHQGRKKRLYKTDIISDENQVEIDHTGDASMTSKKVEKERIAMGFSKNAELIADADKMVLNVLGEKDINMSNRYTADLDSLSDEDRNNSELDDSFVPTMVPSMLPAGSVW